MTELLKNLAEYGAIGLVAIIALWWAWRMYKDKNLAQEKHQKAMSSLQGEHQQEMEALRERYITKAETWMQKYHELAKSQTEVLDAIERRYGR